MSEATCRLPLPLTVLVALFSAVATLAVSHGMRMGHGGEPHHAHPPIVITVSP